jgi:hypothetical protein
MLVSVDRSTKTLIATFTDSEWETLGWVLDLHGPLVFDDLLRKFILARTAQKEATEMEDLHKQVKALSPNDKADILDKIAKASKK